MIDRIFEEAPLHKQSFMQKLLKQYPEENCIIRINNWLATKPIKDIKSADISKLCKKYKTNLYKTYARNLEEFYATYLNNCFSDHTLSNEEINDLNHLKEIFHISNERAESIYNQVAEKIYKHNIEEIIKDGIIDAEERDFITKLREQIKLPDRIANKIMLEMEGDYVQHYIDLIVSDKELSPEEEKELEAITKNLGVALNSDKKTLDLLNKYKVYWAIENRELPTVKSDIRLQETEHCYYQSQADWHEEVDGILTRIDNGQVYLTNKRVIFIGEAKTTNIRIEKILTCNIMDDGVEIDKENGKDPVVKPTGDAEMMGRILRRLLK